MGNGTCDQQTLGVTGTCDKLQTESSHIPSEGTEDVEVEFASGASASGDLPDFERSAAESGDGRIRTHFDFRQIFAAFDDELFALEYAHAVF